MGEMWGYARVSTEDQNPDLQVDALVAASVPQSNIVVEQVSGAAKVRPLFAELLTRLRPGDTLAVWKVDRLGRNTLAALETAQALDAGGVRIVITTLGLDMSTPAGRLVFGIMCQLAEYERELTLERIHAGIAAAKARGKQLGRKHRLSPHQRREAGRLASEGKTVGQIADLFGVGRTVAWRAVRDAAAQHSQRF